MPEGTLAHLSAMILCVRVEPLVPLLDHVIGHPFGQQTYPFDLFAGAQVDQPFNPRSHRLWQQIEHIDALALVPERHAVFAAMQKEDAALREPVQEAQGPIAQIRQPQAAWGHLLLTQDTVQFWTASLLQVRSFQSSTKQIPAHRNLEARFVSGIFASCGPAASTA